MPAIFFSNLDPQIGGILRGAPPHLHKSEVTVIDNTPIFPRTEKVLAESPATLREGCSPEMMKISKHKEHVFRFKDIRNICFDLISVFRFY